jgi:hypothetical protein
MDAGHDTADPAALGRRHEFLHQRKVDAIEPADAGADKEAHDGKVDPAIVRREVQQAGGDREVQHGPDEHHAPADPVGEPAPDIGADDRADAGTHQHDSRLPEGQFPGANQEGQHKADQEVIEEFERVADDGGHQDLDLVASQTRLAIEYLEHGVSPRRLFILFRAGVAPAHRLSAEGIVAAANDKPRETRGTSAQKRWRRSCRPHKPERENNCASCLNHMQPFCRPHLVLVSAVHTPDLFKVLLLAVAVWAASGTGRDGREAKISTNGDRRAGLCFIRRFCHALRGSKYLARGRGDRCRERRLRPAALSPGDGKEFLGRA